jgi:hypothetical protein
MSEFVNVSRSGNTFLLPPVMGTVEAERAHDVWKGAAEVEKGVVNVDRIK